MANRWVTTLGYEVVKVDGSYLVCRKGRRHVKSTIPDEDVSLHPVCRAVDYDEAVEIAHALRNALAAKARIDGGEKPNG